MAETIDYYFTAASSFTYIGHRALVVMAKKHGLKLNLKPFNLAQVWEVSKAVPPSERSPTRQRYRFLELQRAAWFRQVKINHKPANFPTDPARADLCCAALLLMGKDASEFLERISAALWVDDRQIADESVISELLEKCGHDATVVLAASKQENAIALRDKNSSDAIKADAIGAPCYVYKNEVFWGQDRLEMLEAMIVDGRSAFTAD